MPDHLVPGIDQAVRVGDVVSGQSGAAQVASKPAQEDRVRVELVHHVEQVVRQGVREGLVRVHRGSVAAGGGW